MTASTIDPDSPPLLITERDTLGALQVLEQADPDPDVVIVLSDEEILALDGPDALRVSGSPYLDQDAVHRETASASSLRGLIARRLVNPTDQAREAEGDVVVGHGDPGRRMIQLERGLAGILTLRRIPEAIAVVDRTSADVRTRLVEYLFADGAVLEEFVASDGFHHFSVLPTESLVERLAQFVDPHGAASVDGEVEEVSVADLAALADDGGVRTLSTLTAVSGAESRRATVLAFPESVRMVDNGDEDPSSLDPESLLAISDVSADGLRDLLTALVPETDSAAT